MRKNPFDYIKLSGSCSVGYPTGVKSTRFRSQVQASVFTLISELWDHETVCQWTPVYIYIYIYIYIYTAATWSVLSATTVCNFLQQLYVTGTSERIVAPITVQILPIIFSNPNVKLIITRQRILAPVTFNFSARDIVFTICCWQAPFHYTELGWILALATERLKGAYQTRSSSKC